MVPRKTGQQKPYLPQHAIFIWCFTKLTSKNFEKDAQCKAPDSCLFLCKKKIKK